MTKERNEQPINPYAPPLTALTPAPPPSTQDRPPVNEALLLELLNSLAKDPIQAVAYLDEFLFDGEVRSDRSNPGIAYIKELFFDPDDEVQVELKEKVVGKAFIATMVVTAIVSLCCVLMLDFRGLAWSVFVGALVALLTAVRFSEVTTPKRQAKPIKLHAGEYQWLISDGGMLITTPAKAQWAIPWHNIERIHCNSKVWELLAINDPSPPWRMRIDAFSDEDAKRFQQVVDAIRSLASARRPHPVCFADQVQWSDQMQMLSGLSWNVLLEGPRAWCDISGLVCSLPAAKAEYQPPALILSDLETGWTIELPAPMQS